MEPNDLIKNFHQRELTPERQAITHVSHALGQVRDLPRYAAHDAAVDPTVRIACLEAFYVSVRLLAEFFVRKPAGKHEDYTAWSFLPSWQPAPEDAAGWLGEQWTIASQQVMHLSKKRLQDDVNNPRHEDTSEDDPDGRVWPHPDGADSARSQPIVTLSFAALRRRTRLTPLATSRTSGT